MGFSLQERKQRLLIMIHLIAGLLLFHVFSFFPPSSRPTDSCRYDLVFLGCFPWISRLRLHDRLCPASVFLSQAETNFNWSSVPRISICCLIVTSRFSVYVFRFSPLHLSDHGNICHLFLYSLMSFLLPRSVQRLIRQSTRVPFTFC